MNVAPFKLSPEAQKTVTAWNNEADARVARSEAPPVQRRKNWRERIYDANTLSAKTFDPVRWMVPGIIPEGVTILAGKPKIGKSWMALDVCLAAADGNRYTLGDLKPRHGDCLYLALEDNERRMQKRIRKLLPADWVAPDRLDIAHEWPRADQGGIADLRAWCLSVEKPTLIQIDTLQKFRPMVRGSDTYASDYGAVTELLSLTKEFPGLCIIIVHHDRKMVADDPFDTVSGTLGITGAADTIIIIKKDSGVAKLHVRGRDVEDQEIPLRFQKESCKWTKLNAEDTEASLSAERQAIVDAVEALPDGMSIPEIMTATGRSDRNAVDQLLWKMQTDGEIKRIRRGVYGSSKISKISKKETEPAKPIENKEKSNSGANLTNLTDLTGGDEIDDADRPASYWERTV